MKRKEFIKKAASIVAVTTFWRPAYATQHCNISGIISGNLSRPAEPCIATLVVKEPEFWITHPGCWPLDITILNSEFDALTGRVKEGTDFSVLTTLSEYVPNLNTTCNILECLTQGDMLTKAIASHVLTYLHPNINHDISPEDIVTYLELISKQVDYIEAEVTLTNLLIDHYDNKKDEDDPNLILRAQ